MKHIITIIFLFIALSSYGQKTWINTTDTLTNTQSDTVVVSTNISYPSKHATIFAKEVVDAGTATGTIALQGSINGSDWYSVETGISGSALAATQTATVGGIVCQTSPVNSVWNGTTEVSVGSSQYRFLRVITAQTGTGTSYYSVQIIWK